MTFLFPAHFAHNLIDKRLRTCRIETDRLNDGFRVTEYSSNIYETLFSFQRRLQF